MCIAMILLKIDTITAYLQAAGSESSTTMCIPCSEREKISQKLQKDLLRYQRFKWRVCRSGDG